MSKYSIIYTQTYHYDYRGSTVAITDESGAVTDTFEYDSYGKLINRTGERFVIFGYNGRDGVITDANGLLYMRARYYSPELRRFINADIIPGEISDSTSLNRYAYVNGNPISFVDPFGLKGFWSGLWNGVKKVAKGVKDTVVGVGKVLKDSASFIADCCVKSVESVSLYVLNACLFIEKNLKEKPSGKYNELNYEYNSNLEKHLKGGVIDDQEAEIVKNFRFRGAIVNDVGCEAIAVYNARVLLKNENVSLADTIRRFEEQGAVTGWGLINGSFGGNPYSISRVLESYGLDYTTIDSFGAISAVKPGIYIVSYWNSLWLGHGIHTITIEVKENGEVQCYNYGRNTDKDKFNEDISDLKNNSNVQFVSGYKLEQPISKTGRK